MRKGASEDAMLAAAGSFLLDPRFAVPAGGCLRPVALHALSHALDARLASRRTAAHSGRDEDDGKSRKKQRKGGDADAVETCFRPTVVIKKPDSGKFTLFWFIGDEGTPFDNVLIEVD